MARFEHATLPGIMERMWDKHTLKALSEGFVVRGWSCCGGVEVGE